MLSINEVIVKKRNFSFFDVQTSQLLTHHMIIMKIILNIRNGMRTTVKVCYLKCHGDPPFWQC